MTDRPIIFSASMIRALLAGRKTMTRRVLKPQGASKYWQRDYPGGKVWVCDVPHRFGKSQIVQPAYMEGDRLWVRENCRAVEREDGIDGVLYAADNSFAAIENTSEAGERFGVLFQYRGRGKGGIGNAVPPIHMPRWASRLTIVVTGVKVERLQAITSADAIKEGIAPTANSMTIDCDTADPREQFRTLWNSIHGLGAWDENPFVSAISFHVHRCNIEAMP